MSGSAGGMDLGHSGVPRGSVYLASWDTVCRDASGASASGLSKVRGARE